MKKLRYVLVFMIGCLLSGISAQESLNMNLLYNYDLAESFNDCWGYVDAAGNEYAIIGTTTKIFFFNVTDPDNVEMIEIFTNNDPPGLNMGSSSWRDFKTHGTKAYACADVGSEGLLVFDLSGLPDVVTLEEQNTTFFTRSHNIFIDSITGKLYTAGARVGSTHKDMIILDLDPLSLIAEVDLSANYIHDLYVHNDTAYCSHGGNGLYVWYLGDPANPQYIANVGTGGYNHSSWPTENRNYLVYAEEVPQGQPLRVVDMTELNDGNIEVIKSFKFPLLDPLENNRPHNPFIKDNLVYVSYYHDGVQIFDISNPMNPTVAGYYDTYHQNTNYNQSFPGCWGVYPYLPSGNIIASDINNGFFLLEYVEAPLPVDLISFSATAEEDRVKLQWSTASEENSELFEIQRSADGRNFETIGKVNARGNSDTTTDYLFYDNDPFSGNNYYRLKQIDLDDKFEYSPVEVVRFDVSVVDIYPTLITAYEPLNFVFSENTKELKVQVLSIHGQLLKTAVIAATENSGTGELLLGDLENGAYIVQAFDGKQQTSQKIVIAR